MGATRTAASASLADVQAAVAAASDGDTVLIPNGSATWTGGISTTKQIIIRAQNYTPTPAGTAGTATTSRNVTIQNNSSVPLFQFTSGNSYHVGLGGIRFNEGTGGNNHVRFVGNGAKVPFLFDSYFQCKQRNGSATSVSIICWLAAGGVAWNIYVSGEGFPGGAGGSGPDGASIYVQSSHRAWETASTIGSLDITGTVNLYIEDSTFYNVGQCPDIEDQARVVMRHCLFDGAWGLTHGFTGIWGGRHWEVYDSTYTVTDRNRAIASRYFWCRAGTGVFTDCVVNDHVDFGEWGHSKLLDVGDNTSPSGGWLMPRQPGCGHDGTAYVSDPIYIWNNTGSRAYSWGINTSAGAWDIYVQEGRDIYVNNGAKPAYAKFAYPHPLRQQIQGGVQAPTITTHPQSVTVTAGQSAVFTVAAGGTPPLAYQWQKNQVDILGATSSSYTIVSAQASDAASYRCRVSNAYGSATSSSATLTVNPVSQDPPSITSHPQSLTRTVGQSATFAVAATGTAPLVYQWQKNSLNVAGASSTSYTISGIQQSDAGSYRCVVTNPYGAATSSAATLTVQSAPLAITTTSLPDGVVGAAYAATFAATGGTPSYTWSIASGALPAGLALNAVSGGVSGTPAGAGSSSFTVRVSDSGSPQQVNTKAFTLAILEIAPPPTTVSIWSPTAAPTTVDAGADSPVELGVKFRSDVAGSIVGVRFYKSSLNTGTHVASLWSSVGTRLANATFSGETASGWQQAYFITPVQIQGNTTYIASYHCPNGHYSEDQNYFQTSGFDNPPLHALSSTGSGGNNIYAYGPAGSFPNQTYNSANYWVDVLFQPQSAPSGSPPVVVNEPIGLTRTVGESATFSVAATGTAPLAYQWQRNRANISGATSASYTIASVQQSDAAAYRCIVSNSYGSAASAEATLTVNVAPAVATYYVDDTAGNDSNPGTASNPWRRCPGMIGWTGTATLRPGDTVTFKRTGTWTIAQNLSGPGLELRGGVHYVGNQWSPTAAATGRAILRASGRHEAGVVRIWEDHESLPTWIEGFEIDGGGQRANLVDINHAFWRTGLTRAVKRIENCLAHGNSGNGTEGDYKYGIIVSDHSSNASGWVANVEILSTVVYDTPRDGICLYPGDNGMISNVVVRACEVFGTGTDPSYSEGHGFLLKGNVKSSVIEYSYAHNVSSSAVFIAGPGNGTGPGPSGSVVRYNILQTADNNGVIRFYGSGSKSVDILANIVLENEQTGGLSFSGNSGSILSRIYNNTFFDAFVDLANPTSIGTIEFRNNIIYELDDVPLTDLGGDITEYSHNLLFREGGGTLVRLGAGTFTAVNLTTWDANSLSANPLFKDAANLPTGFQGTYGTDLAPNHDGLSLQSTSPALATGLILPASFAGTINSVARPLSSAWDLGAYQSRTAAAAPLPPSRLRVVTD